MTADPALAPAASSSVGRGPRRSLRTQLVWAVALVHAVMMLAFVGEQVWREHGRMHEDQVRQATVRVQVLAAALLPDLQARDRAALAQVMQAMRSDDELRHSMVIDAHGVIVAHTDERRVGQALAELPSAPDAAGPIVLPGSDAGVDVLMPMRAEHRLLGWVRLGLKSDRARADLDRALRSGLAHAAAAIAVGALIAAWLARRVTRRLALLESAADAVRAGDPARRTRLDGDDEPARLSRAFDQMLDAQAATNRALAEAEARHRLALDAAQLGAWRWTIARDHTEWLSDREQLLGAPPAAGWPDFRQMVLDEDRPAFLDAARRVLHGESDRYEARFRLRRTDGRVVHLFAHGRLVHDEGGQALAMIGVTQDVTQEAALRDELLRHREHLEELVRQRTAELEHARAEAEHLSRAKSDFLAHMSHEVRTPLNAMLGMAQLGRDRSPDAPDRQRYAEIVRAGEHLLSIVNDVLDVARMEAGRVELAREPIALQALLRDTAEWYRAQAAEKGLVLEYTVAPGVPPWVLGDERRLRQILVNLLSNAVKFTDQGEVHVRAAAFDGWLHLKVRDTGPGMDADMVARLFRPFEQADASLARRFGGSGLGLAISQGLARRMGGEISVDTAPGAGSAFTLSLPFEPCDDPGASSGTVPASGRAALHGCRLLVVDDVEVNRIVAEAMLKQAGAEVLQADSAEQALEIVAREGAGTLHAVLMDVQMPGMDGLEATRRLARLAPGLPVIGLTAYATADDRQRCEQAGMVAQVGKPVVMQELVRAIESVTRAAAGRARA